MKVIQPVNIWQNGENLEATLLNASNVQDNQDYSTNTYAWDWVATQLNLTIIGDYVPPVVEPIVSEEIITE